MYPVKRKEGALVSSQLDQVIMAEGPPQILQSDNTNMKDLCKKYRIRRSHGRPRHPKSQGQVERVQQTICRRLSRCLYLQPIKWVPVLSQVVYDYNCSKHCGTEKLR